MIRLVAAPSVPWVVLAILGCIAVAVYGYRADRKSLGLIALRSTSLIILLLFIFHPVMDREVVTRTPGRVLLLFDSSWSMAFAGPDGTPRHLPLLAAARRLMAELPSEIVAVPVAFDRAARPVENLDGVPAGSASDLALALESSRGLFAGKSPAAVFLFSDGAATGSGDILLAADKLKAPIYTLWPDEGDAGARVVTLDAPQVQSAGRGIDITATVAGRGPLRVTLLEGTRIVATKDVTAGVVRFSPRAIAPGLATYRVTVKGTSPDSYSADNSARCAVRILPPRDILLLAGSLSWEYKYLREALESLPTTNVHVVAFDDTRSVYVGGELGRKFAKPSEWSEESGSTLAAVVLLDVSGRVLPSKAASLLAGWASSGRIGIAAAGRATFENQNLNFLPARISQGVPAPGDLKAIRQHAALSAALPQAGGHAFVLAPTGASEVLTTYSDGAGAILAGRIGLGRAIMVGPEVWRSAWTSGDSMTVISFWRGVARHLIPDAMEPFTFTVSGAAIPGGRLAVSIKADSKAVTMVRRVTGPGLNLQNDAPAARALLFSPEAEGEYEIALHPKDHPENSLQEFVRVSERGLEHGARDRDTELMQTLSDRSGGRALRVDEITSVIPDIVKSSVTVRREVTDLWDHPAMLLGIIGLLASEWLIRRRRGLR